MYFYNHINSFIKNYSNISLFNMLFSRILRVISKFNEILERLNY